MSFRIYEYEKCSTCRKAIQFLNQKNVKFERRPIVDSPPSLAELKKMLELLKQNGKSFKNLFNTSGELYRELKVSEKIKNGMTEKEAMELLSKNGKLIKRPFFLTPNGGTVGFDEEIWNCLIS